MKKLYIRIHAEQYTSAQLGLIASCFSPYFSTVHFLYIEEQRKELDKFVQAQTAKVISLDKFLPLEHNLDVSRVFNIHGKYQFHDIKYPGRIAKDEHVIIYDHDSVGGIQLKMLTALLEAFGCTVSTHIMCNDPGLKDGTVELLDLADFTTQGLKVEVNGTIIRIPYFTNPELLESRASIPKEKYEEFKTQLLKVLEMV